MSNNIKIAITNLGKYSEGELVFEWLTLPATIHEIEAILDAIGIDEEYEEYFISDYEAPSFLKIGEYTSVDTLNEIAEALEEIDGIDAITSGNYDAGDVINLAHSLEDCGYIDDALYFVDVIVSEEELDEMVQHKAQGYGWQSVKFFLGGIEWMNDDYYLINGYGNVEDLTPDHLESIVSDLMGEFMHEYGI